MKEIDLQLWWNKIKKHDFFLSTMAIILSIIFFVLALIQLDYIARVASHDGTMDQKFIWTCFVIMVITAFPIWFSGTIKKSYVKKFALQSFDQYLAEKLIAVALILFHIILFLMHQRRYIQRVKCCSLRRWFSRHLGFQS